MQVASMLWLKNPVFTTKIFLTIKVICKAM